MGTHSTVKLRETLQILGQLQCELPQHHIRREGQPRLCQADQFPGALEPQPGRQGKSQHEPVGKRQFLHQWLHAQRRQQLLQQLVYGKHKEFDGQPHLPHTQHQMVALHNDEHRAAHPGLDAECVVSQHHRNDVAVLPVQAQARCRQGALVRENQDVIFGYPPELTYSEAG